MNSVSESDVLAYRDEKLPSLYKNDPAISVLNEIISFFVEDIPHDKLIDFYQGVLDVEDLILSDFDIKVTKDERYWPLFEALMPIVAENLTKQKEYYNGENKKTIVHSREFYAENGGEAISKRGITNGSERRGYRSIEGQSRVNRTDSQGERGKGGEVDRFSINTDMTEEDAYKASLLEEAMRMEREATSNGMDIAQEIADATGWVRLANGEWKYYVVSYSFSTSYHNKAICRRFLCLCPCVLRRGGFFIPKYDFVQYMQFGIEVLINVGLL